MAKRNTTIGWRASLLPGPKANDRAGRPDAGAQQCTTQSKRRTIANAIAPPGSMWAVTCYFNSSIVATIVALSRRIVPLPSF
jgi:hypothetical protein